MSAAKGNGTGAAPKDPKGDGKGKDDTIAKVTGVAIATGIAYSLYKSFIAGKKSEEPAGYREFDHAHSEPFHEHVVIEKPEILSDFEANAKGKAGELKNKAGEVKGAIEEKSREAASAIKGKGQAATSAIKGKGEETKEWAADKEGKVREGTADIVNRETSDKDYLNEGKDYVSSKGNKAKDTGSGWFRRTAVDANKGKEEAEKAASDVVNKAGSKAERTKEAGKGFVNDKKKIVEDGPNFFDKVGAEAKREKEEVKRAAVAGEKNVEKAGSAVAGKASELAHKVLPGGKSKSGESAWSKAGASNVGTRGAGGDYGIVRGDTLWSISRRYGVTIEELKTVNGIWNADYIVAGDTLTIPS